MHHQPGLEELYERQYRACATQHSEPGDFPMWNGGVKGGEDDKLGGRTTPPFLVDDS